MQDRIIAVNSNCYHGYPIEEAIRGISAAGFHYIELTATKGWTEHVFPDHSFRSLLRVQDLLDKNAPNSFFEKQLSRLYGLKTSGDFFEK